MVSPESFEPLVVEVPVHAVQPARDPAAAGLQEGDADPREAVADPPPITLMAASIISTVCEMTGRSDLVDLARPLTWKDDRGVAHRSPAGVSCALGPRASGALLGKAHARAGHPRVKLRPSRKARPRPGPRRTPFVRATLWAQRRCCDQRSRRRRSPSALRSPMKRSLSGRSRQRTSCQSSLVALSSTRATSAGKRPAALL